MRSFLVKKKKKEENAAGKRHLGKFLMTHFLTCEV